MDGASNAFASALWALDYMHWHAAHHAAGVNFHNKRWIYTDTIYLDSSGNFQINPKAYAIKAFELGSHGRVEPLTISDPEGINLTAYAVRDAANLFVTIINKDHGPGARQANVTVVAKGISKRAAVMFLTAPNGDVTAKTGVTLGGASINNGSWDGKWTPLRSDKVGQTAVTVPAKASAHEGAPQTELGRFFTTLKNMTVNGYYTSEIGIHQDLQYQGNTYLPAFPECAMSNIVKKV